MPLDTRYLELRLREALQVGPALRLGERSNPGVS